MNLATIQETMHAINRNADRGKAEVLRDDIHEVLNESDVQTAIFAMALAYADLLRSSSKEDQNVMLAAFPLLTQCLIEAYNLMIDANDSNHRMVDQR